MSAPTLADAIAALASVDDGAVTRDHVGFNGTDTHFGNRLAASPQAAWSPEVEREAWEMLRKYRAQLDAHGIDYEAIPEPPKVASNGRSKDPRVIDFEGGKFVIRFRYNPDLVAAVKRVPGARWNLNGKNWTVPAYSREPLTDWAARHDFRFTPAALEDHNTGPVNVGSVDAEGDLLLISFDYDPALVAAVKTEVPGRAWDGNRRMWVAPLTSIRAVRKFAEAHHLTLTPTAQSVTDVEAPTGPTIGVSPNGEFAVRFPYSHDLISRVRDLPGAHWHAELVAWTVDPDAAIEVAEFADATGAVLSDAARELLEAGRLALAQVEASAAGDADIEIPTLARDLYPFQRAGVAYAVRHKRVLIADQPGLGKALGVYEPVMTPGGWRPIGSLSVGDLVFGVDGQPTSVLGVFPQGRRAIVRVHFNDGVWVDCDRDHLWTVRDKNQPFHWRTVTTQQMIDGVMISEKRANGRTYKWSCAITAPNGQRRLHIPMTAPVRHYHEDLPMDPYSLGVWLGDGSKGSAGLNTLDAPAIVARTGWVGAVETDRPSVYLARIGAHDRAELRALNLIDKRSSEKFVPARYLIGSVSQRHALLQGLLDTDGYAIPEGGVEFSTTSPMLRDAVRELAESLGGTGRTSAARVTRFPDANGQLKDGQPSWRVNVKLPADLAPFSVPRKLAAYVTPTKYPPRRMIDRIEVLPDHQEAVCIRVANDDGLYLTRSHIVTHNTIQAIATIEHDNAYPAVIICPASLKVNWAREIAAAVPHRTIDVLAGRTPESRFPADFTILNYDIAEAWKDHLPSDLRALVVDESHYIKSPRIARTKAVQAIANTVHPDGIRLCLSGTPVVNNPSEIVSQLKVLDRLGAVGGARGFQARYGYGHHLPELNRKLRSSCLLRRRKDDVLKDLPGRRWVTIPVSGDPAVMAEYRTAEAELIAYLARKAREAALEAGASTPEAEREAAIKAARAQAAEYLVRIGTLRQLAARAKLTAAREWIDTLLDSGQKLITFGWHRATVDDIAANYGGAKIQGGQSLAARQAVVDAFQDSDDVKVVSCQIRAAGVGLTLTAASDVLFLEQGWSPADMDQALDRAHRVGQSDSVTGWLMVVEDTIEADITELIEAKRAVVDQVTDGSGMDATGSVAADLLERLTRRALDC